MAHQFVTERTGKIMKISPAVAQKWLERNTNNRRLSSYYYETLASAMERGEWWRGGEAIKFSKTGVLLEGQHRLQAIIKSGKTITTRVEFGLPDEVFITLDRGKMRNLGDALSMQGVLEAPLTAAAVTWLWRFKEGKLEGRQPSPTQLLEFYENECVGIHSSIPPTRGAQKITRGSLAVALHYQFAKFSRHHADEFMALLGSGANMDTGHPVLILRERLLADRVNKARLAIAEVIAMFINSWNAFVSNRTLRQLKGTTDGMIPKIIGPVWTGDAE